jgi:hypothetical protein
LGAGRKKFEKIYDGEILKYSIGQNGITSAKHSE